VFSDVRKSWETGSCHTLFVNPFKAQALRKAATYSLARCKFCEGKKCKVLPEPGGPLGNADLRFSSPQPETSLNCCRDGQDKIKRTLDIARLYKATSSQKRLGTARVVDVAYFAV